MQKGREVLLRDEVHYFDFAATTFMCAEALNKYIEFQRGTGILWGKGDNVLSDSSRRYFDEAVKTLRRHFGLSDDYSIIFGKNTTELINIVAQAVMPLIRPSDIILVGPYEHHSNFLPWKYIARATDAIFLEMPTDLETGAPNMDFLRSIAHRVKVVAYSTVANTNAYAADVNALNAIFPKETLIFTDESQKVAHTPLTVSDDISGYILSSHKMYGPKNIAGAFIKKNLIEVMRPVILGGGMIDLQQLEDIWLDGEYKFYAGTFDVGLISAWAQACRYIESISYKEIQRRESEYYSTIKKFLDGFDQVRIINGECSARSMLSFVCTDIHPHDIERNLSKDNVIIRSGHMCAQNALRRLGYHSINRISFGLGIRDEDLRALCASLKKCFEGAKP